MEHFDYDLDPVSFITVGTEGVAGERTFYLQAAQGQLVVSLAIEKEHAYALATSLERLFEQLRRHNPRAARSWEPTEANMALLQPVEMDFRVARLGVGIDEASQRVILVADETDDEQDGLRARFVASFAQMHALSRHALEVVGQGRPICPLCGEPVDSDGHFCPRTNGHHRVPDISS